jgi:hypothetical protein
MIESSPPFRGLPLASPTTEAPGSPAPAPSPQPTQGQVGPASTTTDRVLCGHCGRTASNGISCQGSCVADSGY